MTADTRSGNKRSSASEAGARLVRQAPQGRAFDGGSTIDQAHIQPARAMSEVADIRNRGHGLSW
jgi:hypothetical protein